MTGSACWRAFWATSSPNAVPSACPMGLETHLRMPVADYESLRARLAPRRFEDATDCVQKVREIKSEAEIAKIRASCALAGRVFDRVPEFAGEGTPAGRGLSRLPDCAAARGGPTGSVMSRGGAGPDGYGDVISPASSDPLQRG